MALTFSFVLIGCPNPNEEESDTWTKVTEVNELAGTWKGNGVIPIPAQDESFGDEEASVVSIPASSVAVEMTFAYTADEEAAHVDMKIDMKNYFDAMAKAIDDDPDAKALVLMGLMFSGVDVTGIDTITRDHIWTMMEPDSGAEKYYHTEQQTIDKDEILSEKEPVHFNQNKTKIKLVVPKEELVDMGVEKDIEFVMEKQ
jgi:hypothetical protein